MVNSTQTILPQKPTKLFDCAGPFLEVGTQRIKLRISSPNFISKFMQASFQSLYIPLNGECLTTLR